MLYLFGLVLGTGFAVSVAAFAGALGQARAVASAAEAIARQPEATGNIRTLLIIGLAFIESLTIYTLIIALFMLGPKLPSTEAVMKLLAR